MDWFDVWMLGFCVLIAIICVAVLLASLWARKRVKRDLIEILREAKKEETKKNGR